MAKRRGRPPVPADKAKAELLEVRLGTDEKDAFRRAAELSGLALSAWVRERLRRAARKELGDVGESIAFLQKSAIPKERNGK